MPVQPQHETVGIEPRGKNFTIVRTCADGSRHELMLPETGLIFLARMLPQVLQEIFSRRSTRHLDKNGIQPVHAVPVTHVSLNNDLSKRRILISLVDELGNHTGFALEPDLARNLGEGLFRRAADVGKRMPAMAGTADPMSPRQ